MMTEENKKDDINQAEEEESIQETEKEKSDEELIREMQEELKKLTIKDIVVQMMTSLSSLAYQKLGLPKETNAEMKDLIQARLAIDALNALYEVAKNDLDEQEISAFETTIANLRMTYVSESG